MYSWNGIDIDIPDELMDESVLAFVDNPEAPTMGVSITRDLLEESLAEYMRLVLADLSAMLPGFTAVNIDAAALEYDFQTDSGKKRQRQVFRQLDDEVVICTITADSGEFTKARAIVDDMAKSIKRV